jgi:hypothetical protein
MASNFKGPVCDLLRENGCSLKRQGNKHEVWFSPITNYSFTVPRNLKSRHTANDILKQAGIDFKF